MALKPTYRRRLRERALDQYGYVTTKDAEELNVPTVELRKLAQRGGLVQIDRGLYRFEDVPRTGRDQFMEAVLRVGPDAFLAGDAVLALHDLALANPKHIRVVTPHRVRRHLPGFLRVERRALPKTVQTIYEGIPVTTVAQALRDARGEIMPTRLIEATHEAVREGLLRKVEAEKLAKELEEAS